MPGTFLTGIREIPDTVRTRANKYWKHGSHPPWRTCFRTPRPATRPGVYAGTNLPDDLHHSSTRGYFQRCGKCDLHGQSLHGLTIWQETQLLAWVVMPDHLHVLIALGTGESLSRVVQKLKSNTARELKACNPGIGQVWAPAFHDRALRREEDLRNVARYMVLNPVRAGLVRRIGDYPFWNAVWM